MKIALFEVEPWEKKFLAVRLKGHQCIFFEESLSIKHVQKIKQAEILAVFVHSSVKKDIIAQLPNLRFIAAMSTGFDHIDLAACKQRRIPVSNVPSYGENTVAEHALALLLAISRKIVPSVEKTRAGRFDFEGVRGFDLQGRTLGVVGTGRIGAHVVKFARAVGMTVIATDLIQNQQAAQELGFVYVQLNELLRQSDVISLHTPYMPSTHHLLNNKNMKLIKKGCVLINTARGGLVETKALVDCLRSGRLSAVGLDVLENEVALKNLKAHDALTSLNRWLLKQPNVLITPHNAFNSPEAITRIMNQTIENINAFIQGKLKNVVNQ